MKNILLADLSNLLHAAAVIELLDIYSRDPMGGGEPLSDYTRHNLLPALASRQDTVIVLAFEQDKAVGMIIGFEGFSTFACKPLLNIHDVIVHPDFRGQNLAGDMMNVIESIARNRAYCKLTLEVLQGNTAAQQSYSKSGFTPYQLDPNMGHALFWHKLLS